MVWCEWISNANPLKSKLLFSFSKTVMSGYKINKIQTFEIMLRYCLVIAPWFLEIGMYKISIYYRTKSVGA